MAIYAVCFESVDRETAERLHEGLAGSASYLGAMEVGDSRTHKQLWSKLPARCRIVDRAARVFWDGDPRPTRTRSSSSSCRALDSIRSAGRLGGREASKRQSGDEEDGTRETEDRPVRQHETGPKLQHRDHHDPALVVHRAGYELQRPQRNGWKRAAGNKLREPRLRTDETTTRKQLVRSVIGHERAYPMCVHWESGEGTLRPLEPTASRTAAARYRRASQRVR